MSEMDSFLPLYLEELVFENPRTKLFLFHNEQEKQLNENNFEALAKMWAALHVNQNEIKQIAKEEAIEILTQNLSLVIFSSNWPKMLPKPKVEKYEVNAAVFWADHFSDIASDNDLKKKFWAAFSSWFKKFVS